MEILQHDLSDLKTYKVVAEERFAYVRGADDVLREAVSRTSKDVGALTRAVDKMWIVLQAKGLIETRFSDEATKSQAG